MRKKKLIILGSTGSIGRSTLDVVRAHPDRFGIAALSAHTNESKLLDQAKEFSVSVTALSGKNPESDLVTYLGERGIISMIEETEADMVVNGIAGSRGLLPSVAALSSGKDLALANKETIIMAGELVTSLAGEKGRKIIPVDSEHSAIFHLLQKVQLSDVEEIILTASGGAFRDLSLDDLNHVTVEQALKHPTWNMGKKITIDSATMANKGLEIIEANKLFSFPVDRIKVIIHPQSYVHSLIRTIDGALYSQISYPDMRLPIQNALTYPETSPFPFGRFKLTGEILTFQAPDSKKYPLLDLAYRAATEGRAYPIAYNAANEVAVSAFLKGKIHFTGIAPVVERTLEYDWGNLLLSFEQVGELDIRAREIADHAIGEITGESICF
ncbi:MAG: 1-deoxy-D-xylulose-5-phosphate reductoisomerase [Spirochaetes bacterium]|nr:MAG: 1-deoxy-D-xylulose-5-phosphate reductoisomerase [Spirochaetota bacterium]